MRLTFLFIIFCSFLSAQSHLRDFNLKGKVRNLESTTYLYSGNSTNPSGFLDSENFDAIKLNFDQKGNLILRENYLDYRGKLGLFDKTVYQFNFSNQIEKQETTLVQNGEEPKKISQKKTFYYLKNQLIRTDEFNSGRTTDQFWVINHIYNGGRLKKKEIWMEDEIFSTSEFEHRLHNIISEKTFHNDGKQGRKVSFEYDENQNVKNKTTESGNEKTIETFMYDKNVLKEHVVKNKKQEIQLREIFNPEGLLSSTEKINYTKNSLAQFKFEYEFDSQNNWIKCVILENETPKFKVIRTINYY